MRSALLAAFLLFALATPGTAASHSDLSAFSSDSQAVTARLGIAPGDVIEGVALGTSGEELRAILPPLWEAAQRFGILIVAASVGQGFVAEDGMLESETDLDLVVAGRRESVDAFAAALGREWDQSLVFVWYFTQAGGEQAIATIPLPGGADQLSEMIYESMAKEITDGAHVNYAGANSFIFIAKTNDTESDEAFYERMGRLVAILNALGIQTGTIVPGRADFSAITRDEYDLYLQAVPALAA